MAGAPDIYADLRLQQVLAAEALGPATRIAKPAPCQTVQAALFAQAGTLVFIQPLAGGTVAGPSLSIELQTGAVGLAEHSSPLDVLKRAETIYGVGGPGQNGGRRRHWRSSQACSRLPCLRRCPVYKVTSTRILTCPSTARDDARRVLLQGN